MKKIGLIFAMEKEMRLVEGEMPSDKVRCCLSGIGKVNAAMCTQKLIMEFRPDCVISAGCSGSFSDKVKGGDIIVAEETAYHDFFCSGENVGQVPGLPARFPSDPALVSLVVKQMPDAHCGLICCGDQFYVSEAEDRRQKELYPDALAVDMESAAIAQVCYLNGVPFLALRTISDVHTDGLQRKHYSDFWKNGSQEPFRKIVNIVGALLELND